MKAAAGWMAKLIAAGADAGPVAALPVVHPGTDDTAVLAAAVAAAGHPAAVPEYRFCEGRRFRFDLAWPTLKVAFEREGGTWQGGRHARGAGYRRDVEKYNLAAVGGWLVVRGTVDMMRDGAALRFVLDALEHRAGK